MGLKYMIHYIYNLIWGKEEEQEEKRIKKVKIVSGNHNTLYGEIFSKLNQNSHAA